MAVKRRNILARIWDRLFLRSTVYETRNHVSELREEISRLERQVKSLEAETKRANAALQHLSADIATGQEALADQLLELRISLQPPPAPVASPAAKPAPAKTAKTRRML